MKLHQDKLITHAEHSHCQYPRLAGWSGWSLFNYAVVLIMKDIHSVVSMLSQYLKEALPMIYLPSRFSVFGTGYRYFRPYLGHRLNRRESPFNTPPCCETVQILSPPRTPLMQFAPKPVAIRNPAGCQQGCPVSQPEPGVSPVFPRCGRTGCKTGPPAAPSPDHGRRPV